MFSFRWLTAVSFIFQFDVVRSSFATRDVEIPSFLLPQRGSFLEDEIDDEDCPLRCANGGACIRKTTTTTSASPDSDPQDDWQCLCPEGYAGPFCELKPRPRELSTTTTAHDAPVNCGYMLCYNGGKCMNGGSANHPKPLCDCSTAWSFANANDLGFAHIRRFVGRTCEVEVGVDDYCTGSDRNKKFFCVNGGKCRIRAPKFEEKPCRCPDGFTGRHCEYAKEEVQECVLNCNGKGECVHGSNPFSSNGANGILDLTNDGAHQYMYCRCDDKHAGTNCEYEYKKCGGYKHFCFHNSTCVNDNGKKECQCNMNGIQKVAGDACEFRATDNCMNPKTAKNSFVAKPAYKMSPGVLTFCVNNGKCVTDPNNSTSGDLYCECDEEHWSGKRCEHKVVPTVAPHETPPPTFAVTETGPPTYYASWTEWPTTAAPTEGFWLSPSPSPAPQKHEEPNPDPNRQKNPLSESSGDGGNLTGAAIFGIVMLAFATSFTLALVCYREHRKNQFHKGIESNRTANSNLHLDMISEETDADNSVHSPNAMADVDITASSSDDAEPSEKTIV